MQSSPWAGAARDGYPTNIFGCKTFRPIPVNGSPQCSHPSNTLVVTPRCSASRLCAKRRDLGCSSHALAMALASVMSPFWSRRASSRKPCEATRLDDVLLLVDGLHHNYVGVCAVVPTAPIGAAVGVEEGVQVSLRRLATVSIMASTSAWRSLIKQSSRSSGACLTSVVHCVYQDRARQRHFGAYRESLSYAPVDSVVGGVVGR